MKGRPVYSSDGGRLCPSCGWPTADCRCSREREGSRSGGVVRIRRETRGRGGKTVTSVSEVPVDGAGLRELARSLRRRCGSGGTVKNGAIEIQGDHRETIRAELEKAGFKVKLAGG